MTAVILALLFAAAIALQSARVQTWLARKAVAALTDKIDGDLRFERIHVRPFDALVLEQVAVVDRHPWDTTASGRVDTLFRAGTVSATFSLKGLFDKSGLHLRNAVVRDARLNLTVEPSDEMPEKGVTNLARIFRLQPRAEKKPMGNIFDAARVEVDGMTFTLKNYKVPSTVTRPDAIDWSDLHVSDIHVQGRRLKLSDGVMTGIADEVSFREKSGYRVSQVSGQARVGNGVTLLEDLRLQDGSSRLDIPLLRMTYADTQAWSSFLTDVRLEGTIRPSRLSLNSLGYFAPALKGKDLAMQLKGQVEGTVSDLSVKQLSVQVPEQELRVDGAVSLSGLPVPDDLRLEGDFHPVSCTAQGLEQLLRTFAPGSDIPLRRYTGDGTLRFDGTLRGTPDLLSLKGEALAGDATLLADLQLRNLVSKDKPFAIGGDLSAENLDVGRIAGVEGLGDCSLRTRLDAVLSPGHPNIRIDTLFIDKLTFRDYNYTGIAAAGTYAGDVINGKLICNDPNLNFLFQGAITPSRKTRNAVYQFYANLGYADLHALNLDKRDQSKMRMQVRANFNRVDGKDLLGNIDVRDLVLQDENGTHDVGDITIASHVGDDINRIRLSSSFAEGSFVGSAFLDTFLKDLQALSTRRELPALYTREPEAWSGNTYQLSLMLHDTKDVLSFFVPGLYVADSTSLSLSVRENAHLLGNVRSQRLAYRDKYLKDIRLSLDNADSTLVGDLTASEFSLSPLLTRANRLLLMAHDDHIGLGLSYDNETDLDNRGELLLSADLDRAPDDSLRLHARMLPSNLYLNGNAWSIDPTGIEIGEGHVRIEDLLIKGGDQSIRLSGGFASAASDTLRLQLSRFDLGAVNYFLRQDFGIQGIATGQATLISPVREDLGLLADVVTESARFGGEPLGTLHVKSTWDESIRGFRLGCTNDLDGKRTLMLGGGFVPSSRSLDGIMKLDGFSLSYLTPFLQGIFSRMEGGLSGIVRVKGPLDRLDISSEDASLQDALLTVDFTKATYRAQGPVRIDSNGLWFDDVSLSDLSDAHGVLSGGIGWDHLKDFALDVHLRFREMEVLNLGENDNPSFYGNVYASGTADITGPFHTVQLNVNAATAKNGQFHVPMDSYSSAVQSDLLTFKEEDKVIIYDPYEQMMVLTPEKEAEQGGGFGVKLRINVNPSTEALIEVDKASGNVLTGRGRGLIDVDVRGGDFTINGDYAISSGQYHFVGLGVAKRDFTIQDGSQVRFNGNIMDSDLNINALYRTKTSIATLISDTTAVSSRRTVECGISITDKLQNPRLAFTINVPDLDPTTQARVQSALNSDDRIQKQFLSLLLSNSFIPEEESGIVNTNSSLLLSNVTEIMANQLNSILQKLDIPIDLGLDYQQSANGNDIFDVAISTELFNNRVLVNGALGNRQYGHSTATDEVVGDFDIEFKLDKSGTVRLTLFSHSADQYTSYLDNSQRNGIGITYQREFNTLRDLLRMLSNNPQRTPRTDPVRPSEGRNRVRIAIEPQE